MLYSVFLNESLINIVTDMFCSCRYIADASSDDNLYISQYIYYQVTVWYQHVSIFWALSVHCQNSLTDNITWRWELVIICWEAYAVIIVALKLELELEVKIACLQELYTRKFSHEDYLLYWLIKKWRNCRVTIAIWKNLLDQLIIEICMNLISYFYIIIINIWKSALLIQVKRDRTQEEIQEEIQKIWIVNYYNN